LTTLKKNQATRNGWIKTQGGTGRQSPSQSPSTTDQTIPAHMIILSVIYTTALLLMLSAKSLQIRQTYGASIMSPLSFFGTPHPQVLMFVCTENCTLRQHFWKPTKHCKIRPENLDAIYSVVWWL
jgi:hypothetical protein